MMQNLITKTGDSESGFYLRNHSELYNMLARKTGEGKKVLLAGVSHALLDFSADYKLEKNPTLIVMETGGMKGRKKEMLRSELHEILCSRLGVEVIHSEYGMTELMSQAYSDGAGIFACPPWMKVLVKRQDDPLSRPEENMRGRINIIDLANVYSCSFIESDDLGIAYPGGRFEVLGRMDYSEIRGCNVMV
jgi:hypothetical protein